MYSLTIICCKSFMSQDNIDLSVSYTISKSKTLIISNVLNEFLFC